MRAKAEVRQAAIRRGWNIWALIGIALLIALLLFALNSGPAAAQGWWPFGGGNDRPTPREPVYRQPQAVPAPIPQQAQPAAPGPGPAAGGANWATKNPICLQLEQRLVQEGQKGSQSRDMMPKVEAEMAQVDRAFNVGSSQLEKSCYEYFLFTKSFRNTPQCKELLRQVEVSKRRLADLEAQRQDLSSGRSYQDDIVRELARNNCGANYVDQARRRGGGGGVWGEEETTIGSGGWNPQGSPGGTFKTVCVRLCDGYYFPLSFSTLPSHFSQDAESCSSRCAAPTELYYHPNPGAGMDQAVALQSHEPYTKLKTAFRYRKEYVTGCSCKEAEYVPAATAEQKAEGGAKARRADGAHGVTTGSTEPPAAGGSTPPSGWEPQAN